MSTSEIAAEVKTVREQAKHLNFLAMLAIPELFKFPFPEFYEYLWSRFTEVLFKERDFSKFALGLPRGHGKTIFLKLLILFIVLFTSRKFVLIVCAKLELSESIIGDVCDMLSHPNIVKLFGDWREELTTDRTYKKVFRFRGRPVILWAVGVNGSFRGINEKMRRPDVMIFDDAQTRECALSEVQALEFIDKFHGSMLKAKAPDGCTTLYVGNMYRDLVVKETAAKKVYGCQLRNLKESREWESIVTGGIVVGANNQQKALWEELQPLQQLLSEFRDDLDMGTPETFFAEVLNDPKGGVLKHFNFTKVPPYDSDNEIAEGKFIIIDPSLGKKKSDDMTIHLYYLRDGLPILRKIRIFTGTVPDMVREVILWAITERVPLVLSEDYGFQQSLVQWFHSISQQMGLQGITFAGINRGRLSKNSAILGMLKSLMSGDILLHDDVRVQVFDQISVFDHTKVDNRDDILDNIAYVPYAMAQHPYTMLLPLEDSFNNLPQVIDSRGHYR